MQDITRLKSEIEHLQEHGTLKLHCKRTEFEQRAVLETQNYL